MIITVRLNQAEIRQAILDVACIKVFGKITTKDAGEAVAEIEEKYLHLPQSVDIIFKEKEEENGEQE